MVQVATVVVRRKEEKGRVVGRGVFIKAEGRMKEP